MFSKFFPGSNCCASLKPIELTPAFTFCFPAKRASYREGHISRVSEFCEESITQDQITQPTFLVLLSGVSEQFMWPWFVFKLNSTCLAFVRSVTKSVDIFLDKLLLYIIRRKCFLNKKQKSQLYWGIIYVP